MNKDVIKLIKATQALQKEMVQLIDGQTCDHSVGICLCDYFSILDECDQAIKQLKQPSNFLQLVILKKTCYACPSQWEGVLNNGQSIYIRYRYGTLWVGIGEDIDEAVTNSHNNCEIMKPNNPYDGVINDEQMFKYLANHHNIGKSKNLDYQDYYDD